MKKKGFTLVELLIGLTVLAIIATVFMQALGVGILGTSRDNRTNDALHLAQSQMEYVKSQKYQDYNDNGTPEGAGYSKIDDDEIPEGFDEQDIVIAVRNISGNTSGERLQHITVNVTYGIERTITIEGFKINRVM